MIEERNMRVSAEKAWEVSLVRRGLIAAITYMCCVLLLTVLGHDGVWEHALIPVLGYVISTFSLPRIKAAWIKRSFNQKV